MKYIWLACAWQADWVRGNVDVLCALRPRPGFSSGKMGDRENAALKDSGRYREHAFSFRRASLTCLPFGVGKGGPETFSPDIFGL